MRQFITTHKLMFLYPPHEDELFTFQSYLLSDRVGFISEIGYKHRYRDDSVMTRKRSIINVRCYYLTAHAMDFFCYENRDRLVDYPEFFDQAVFIRNLAVGIYDNAPDLIRSQVKDSFDRAMLKNLDYYRNANNFAAALKSEKQILGIKDHELFLLNRELSSIYHSKAYKLGNLLAGPIRKIKKIFHV